MLKVDKNTCNHNAEIVEVNIGFDCENNIMFENLINLNKTCNYNAEIARKKILDFTTSE